VGYDPAYGARPLKRAIQKEVETPLARKLVAGEVHDGQKIRVDVSRLAGSERGMVFEVESAAGVAAS
jgi:ATP-dependent Clp protease ATP-binding subunit ClpB